MILEEQFSNPLLAWYDVYGRKELPWQSPRDAYRVWVSEIMLQQTQVQTVIPYFNRFINTFPTVSSLAQAAEDAVLSLWSGLGYYSRARNLHSCAKIINEQYMGIFPRDLQLLINLPGIGPSTAAAILSQAYNLPTAILDGNVKRVLTRFFRISGFTEQAQIKKKLWDLANCCMHQERCADYTQAIMDLGATCCTTKNPDCAHCPIKENCLAYKYNEQQLYPTKKIKKPVPLQHQQFLVLQDNKNQIFLEKRPPTGLWGGLWCFPAIDINQCPLDFIKTNHNISGKKPVPIVTFTHRFSHFHLEIQAIRINAHILGSKLAESGGKWFSHSQLATLGLATPTSKIINKLIEDQSLI
ncbi:MAG TPA: A/G-specific adenine glycosylase [Legionella sp.]|nr:A/G-specific adenine glycosylase [Legionella sp.]